MGVPHLHPSLPAPLNESPYQDDALLLFRTHDGSNEECIVPMPSDGDISYQLLTLDAALHERQMMLELFAEERTLPDGSPDVWRPTWLPFASNGAGDSLVWDSVTGQILHYSHETRQANPRAPSLFELFHDIADGLETGKYTYSVHRGIA
jgi:cell wall assembly regulator SMI1